MPKDKPELQGRAFELLLAWLGPDSELAAAEYVRLHQRLAKMFEARGCPSSQDCADETLNRVARQLVEGKDIRTDHPAAYIDGVARFVLREQWSKFQQEDIGEVPLEKLTQNDPRHQRDQMQQEQRHDCLEECLNKLPPESRLMTLEYYAADKTLKIDTRDQMARRLGVASGVLRNRIFKLRNTLRGCVAECLAR